MATIIDILGETSTILSKSKTKLSIINNANIKEIVAIKPSILDVEISENPNLESIQLNKTVLRTLKITENPVLKFVQAVPITNSVIIKNNPLLDYDELFLQFSDFPIVKTYIPNIEITKPEIECDKSLNINDIQFEGNSDVRNKSPEFLNTDNQFIIHNEYYDGRAYPVLTIPKGMLLYTYTHIEPGIDLFANIYNTNNYEDYENEIKFFYSVPYGAKFGIEGKYNHCNIVVLTADVRLLCLLSPAPQNMDTMMFPSKNTVIDNTGKQCILYSKDITHPCELYDHDLCLQKDFRLAMNLHGYINIDIEDSLSNGESWKKTYESAYKNPKYIDIIKQYLQGSCISSAKISGSNYDYINNIFSLHMPENTLFGLPQIALCPIKTHIFDKSHKYIYEKFMPKNWKRKPLMEKFIFENFNYYMVDSCPIADIEKTLEKFKTDIVQNRQYHLFYLLNTYKDPEYPYWKKIGPITAEDVNYLFTYNNSENIVGCVFETVAFGRTFGGKTRRRTVRKNTTRKKKKTTKCGSPFIFSRTSFGMPIMY